MLTTILGLAVPVILKLLEWYLDRRKAKKETAEAFYKFVESFQSDGATKSVKIKISYAEQLKRIEELKKAKP